MRKQENWWPFLVAVCLSLWGVIIMAVLLALQINPPVAP